ncbi:LysR substrate-binding domain-containing protein [Fluoribacter dumoffii]|uniref:hydrogen peroxide-inducible genes activator n=1 Tax=Fluoribacter dumoffii TaxID=463 RepID=UPI00224349F8|nr:hydrogen peroxide-inducible genes activator [Fluoribacter dumoffii]MCW8419640.1 LysR substrate-binding domain-containing protein [Fluoribacter dumoffii]MCW8455657.1 LysR substrate-binding domain-containing protein [Fluoribacter dumoffii]MCW8460264.1 LysR substrate-binding domain-containing protein [Fluoribacter dumoffii]MCW8483743.1 LysR substrate-binding domain-containing protein [Fluoribacter dumoffii]
MNSRLISLKQLYYLVTLYDHQHFGRAAAACFISQSTLSAAITHLEESLEAQLLERDHKTFLFTPLGEEIVRRSRLIIEQSNDLVDYARTQGKLMQGKIYLGVIPTIAPFIISELQNLCQKTYPELTLFIREDTTDNVLHYLGEGKLDLVILALPYPTQDFQTRILCKDYFKMVLPKGWLHRGFDKEISMLPENSIFLLEKEHCLTGHALQACQLKESKKINHFFATSLHTLIQMVSHQPGITFLPNLAINSGILAGTDLAAVPLKSDHAYREIGVAWRTTSHKAQSYILLSELIQQILIKKCTDGE